MPVQRTRVFPSQDTQEMIYKQNSVSPQQQSDQQNITELTEENETNFMELLGDYLRPILLSFKVTGLYYGPTKPEFILLGNSSMADSATFWHEKLYCFLVLVLAYWSSVIALLISAGYHKEYDEDGLFIIIAFSCWFFHTSFNATACLALLPCGKKGSSKFEKLLLHRFTIQKVSHYKLSRVRKGLVLTWIFMISSVFVMMTVNLFTNMSVAKFPPWNRWPIPSTVFWTLSGTYSTAAWLLPLFLYSVICIQLSLLFSKLEATIKSKLEQGTLNLKFLRQKHKELCRLVETADKMLSYIALSTYAGYVPLLCLLFNQIAKLDSNKITVATLVAYVYWSMSGVAILSYVSYFAADVSTKVSLSVCFLKEEELRRTWTIKMFCFSKARKFIRN